MIKGYLVPHPPLLVPGVGTGREIPDTRRAYQRIGLMINDEQPDAVVIISPHSTVYDDYFHISPNAEAQGDFGAFGAPDIRVRVRYDEELAKQIGKKAQEAGIPAGSLGERDAALDHGVMVPLYFIQWPTIVRVAPSGLSLVDHYRFGMCIREAAKALGRRVTLVASGDMSHKLKRDGPYGFAPEGPKHDAFVTESVRAADFRGLLSMEASLRENAAECGLGSLVVLAGMLDKTRVQTEVFSYEGPFGVGYLTASFTGEGTAPSLWPDLQKDRQERLRLKRQNEDPFVQLARLGAEHYVTSGVAIDMPPDLPPEMLEKRAGVFVSVKKDGRLRGCIGTIAPTTDSIAEEIIQNTVSSVAHDARFFPVSADELDALTYSVDVLAPPEPIDSPAQLDAKRYGVIVSADDRRGLLLPNLEGVDTVSEQLSIAMRKGGIRPHEPHRLERFEVVRHGG